MIDISAWLFYEADNTPLSQSFLVPHIYSSWFLFLYIWFLGCGTDNVGGVGDKRGRDGGGESVTWLRVPGPSPPNPAPKKRTAGAGAGTSSSGSTAASVAAVVLATMVVRVASGTGAVVARL